METIVQPINKDYGVEIRPDPDLRTLDELIRLVGLDTLKILSAAIEIRLVELEKRILFLERAL